jgi:hypothetical protein
MSAWLAAALYLFAQVLFDLTSRVVTESTGRLSYTQLFLFHNFATWVVLTVYKNKRQLTVTDRSHIFSNNTIAWVVVPDALALLLRAFARRILPVQLGAVLRATDLLFILFADVRFHRKSYTALALLGIVVLAIGDVLLGAQDFAVEINDLTFGHVGLLLCLLAVGCSVAGQFALVHALRRATFADALELRRQSALAAALLRVPITFAQLVAYDLGSHAGANIAFVVLSFLPQLMPNISTPLVAWCSAVVLGILVNCSYFFVLSKVESPMTVQASERLLSVANVLGGAALFGDRHLEFTRFRIGIAVIVTGVALYALASLKRSGARLAQTLD